MEAAIKEALDVVKQGGVILYPTDTVWGIGCDATNAAAVQKVFTIKQRSEAKSLIVLIDTDAKLSRYVREVPEVAWDLVEHTEKPLTIIYPEALNLANNVIAEDGSVGIRVVKDDFCQQLIHRLNKALVSTSANVSGEPTPFCFSEIDEGILDAVDYVVNLRQDETSLARPSTIMKLELNGTFEFIRK